MMMGHLGLFRQRSADRFSSFDWLRWIGVWIVKSARRRDVRKEGLGERQMASASGIPLPSHSGGERALLSAGPESGRKDGDLWG